MLQQVSQHLPGLGSQLDGLVPSPQLLVLQVNSILVKFEYRGLTTRGFSRHSETITGITPEQQGIEEVLRPFSTGRPGGFIDGENTSVAQIRARLRQAQLNLSWTTVQAPADGFVTNLQLREGFVVGAGGAAAIYTSSGKPFRIIRKVIIRMNTFMNYL
jgi:hypothetical protein